MSPIHEFQIWLVTTLAGDSPVDAFMTTPWGWPTMESLHFLGLCLLIGGVGTFDLRLLGVAKRVPIAAVHHLIPWGIAGLDRKSTRLNSSHSDSSRMPSSA